MNRFIVILSLLFITRSILLAEEEKQIPSDLLENIYAQIAENRETEDFDQTQILEDLQFYAQNPINLNATNKEELKKLQFLSDSQIENLLYYVYMYGGMQNLYELQLIEGLYKQDVNYLLPFVKIEKVEKKMTPLKWKNIKKYGKHEFITRIDNGLETKEGYKFVPEEELTANANKQYLGDPFYSSVKYRFHYKDRILLGLCAEKDAGEQFWGERHKGFDFYSGYLQLNDLGKIKTLIIGDFNASFGQALVMSTSYGMGKSGMVLNIENSKEGLQKCGSTDEYNFFRGIATTYKLGKAEISTFYSNKMIDGDTVNNELSTIKVDGLHRTVSDYLKKNTINMQVIGIHSSFIFERMKLGVTLTNLQLDNKLTPTVSPYNSYYFSGKKQTAGSFDYKTRWRKFYFFGETAVSDKYALASLNGLNFNATSAISFALLHRYYSKKYDVLFASAFGENSRTNNEEGFYLGTEIRPSSNWKIASYADSYRFPWLKFGIDKPSVGYDILVQVDYTPKDELRMYWKFRLKQQEDNIANDTATTPTISTYDKASLRYVLQYSISENLKLKNTLEGTYSKKYIDAPTYGLLLSQDLSYSFTKIPCTIDFRYELFDALNYENRIYTYEKDVLYAFSIPALYGKGSRYYFNLKYKISNKLSCYLKFAQTTYINKDIIGSGLEEITGNQKTDVRILVKWNF